MLTDRHGAAGRKGSARRADRNATRRDRPPALQWYPGDWFHDALLHMCGLYARGMWFECLLLMHQDCDPYGHLAMNGVALSPAQVARLLREPVDVINAAFHELESAGVFSRTSDGTIYSRRMVRDWNVRQQRVAGGKTGAEYGPMGAEHGSKGGRPPKQPRGDKPPSKPPSKPPLPPPQKTPLKPPPSASASSSSSSVRFFQIRFISDDIRIRAVQRRVFECRPN